VTRDGQRFLINVSEDPGTTNVTIVLDWTEELKK
jgi:hypothetical protein